MEAGTEAFDRNFDDPAADVELSALTFAPSTQGAAPALPDPGVRRLRGLSERTRTWTTGLSIDIRRELVWITVIYLSARILLILAAVLLDAFAHQSLLTELANWDGLWYRAIANHGYPHVVTHGQTNLGFFPLYPVTIYILSPVVKLFSGENQIWVATVAGLIISGIGGLVATVFVHRLAEGWWDRATARRATVLFVVFPGAVIFSMVYSEALLMPLAAICIWALERRRWMLAGVTAGLGTAVQPVGLLFGVLCAICAVRELYRGGLRSRDFRMSALASVMSASGVVAFMGFLWAWTGSPMATYTTQRYGWQEKTDLFALVHQVTRVAPSFNPLHFNQPPINLNYVVGTVGAVLAIFEMWLLWRSRRELSLAAIVWSLGITALAMTSEFVPPNPRLLITAFPMLVLLARWCPPRRFSLVVTINVVLLLGLSTLTYYQHVLRP